MHLFHIIGWCYQNYSFWVILLSHWSSFGSLVNMHDFFASLRSSKTLDHHDIFIRIHTCWNGSHSSHYYFSHEKLFFLIILYSCVGKLLFWGPRWDKLRQKKRQKKLKKRPPYGPTTLGCDSQGGGEPRWSHICCKIQKFFLLIVWRFLKIQIRISSQERKENKETLEVRK